MYLSAKTKSLWSYDSTQLQTFREQCLIKDKDKSASNMRDEFFVIEKQSAAQDYLVPNKRTISDNHSDSDVEWSGSDLIWWTIPNPLPPSDWGKPWKPTQFVSWLRNELNTSQIKSEVV